jgi:hypothetical protein
MVMVESADADRDRRRAAALGVRVAWQIDLDDVRGTHLHPRDLGGALLSLDAPAPAGAWRWAGPDWRDRIRTDVTRAVVGVEMQCADPGTVAARWAALLDRPLVTAAQQTARIALADSELRFTAAPLGGADGVTVIDVLAADRERARAAARERGLLDDGDVRLCGTRIRLL